MADILKYELAEKVKELKAKMLATPATDWAGFKKAFYQYAKARDQYIRRGGCRL